MPGETPEFPLSWNVVLRKDHIDETKRILAAALLPILQEELDNICASNAVFRSGQSGVRATCGEPTTGTHDATTFSPATGFMKNQIIQIIDEMTALTQHPPGSRILSDPGSTANDNMACIAAPDGNLNPTNETPTHNIKRVTTCQLTEEIFRPLWAQGEPLLVTGVHRKFQLPWTPTYFIAKYGDDKCEVVDCESGQVQETTVKSFFRSFDRENRKDCLKLKDWPPSSEFKTTFPELYEDFSQAVPMPNYVRRDGVLNIASHFPINAVCPDLGPKMYNAHANLSGDHGSTRLHMDMADALNILLYATDRGPDEVGCAAWDIFCAEDSNAIRDFIKKKFDIHSGQDPIHSQQVYLNDHLRQELWDNYGVKSFRVYQTVGEAIFIPAGCAHQVCNLSDCIKVAVDFVSLENIARCQKLTQEFRDENQGRGSAWKQDILQLRSMMWFAWLSCCSRENNLM
ncbi:hypothetical protein B0H11DRAFT_1905114 [Mycena galericulata]|nr:hypothetical protein B0H11DRAFT_1905114 [Mycena galericulata]